MMVMTRKNDDDDKEDDDYAIFQEQYKLSLKSGRRVDDDGKNDSNLSWRAAGKVEIMWTW